MGYDTVFSGTFKVEPPLSPEHRAYLARFAETRRVRWKKEEVASRPDPIREAVGLPVGKDGAFFVGEFQTDEWGSLMNDPGVANINKPPASQPGLWCQWVPTADGAGIQWDESEKFYHYVEWLEYLMRHFLVPWGYRVTGTVYGQGELPEDRRAIIARGATVEVEDGGPARIDYWQRSKEAYGEV